MKNTWKQENSFWVKQALNVSRHCPADLMLRAASAPILFVGAQLVGLLLTTIATTGHYNLRQWRTRLPNNRTHQTTLRLKLLLVERL